MFDDVVSRGTRSFLFYFSGGDLMGETSACRLFENCCSEERACRMRPGGD